MKFPGPVHAAEGLTSYARVSRVRPVHTLITIVEALLSLTGVVLVILFVRYGSFEKAGHVLDASIGCVVTGVQTLVSHTQK